MSGGYFNYDQYRLHDIESSIKEYSHEIEDDEELLKEFKNAIKYLKIARVYTQRIDWYISGDDGRETFFERLKKDLKEEGLSEEV